jgi:hypothetical protein
MWGEILLGEVRLWVVGAGRLNKRRISDFGGFRILYFVLCGNSTIRTKYL